MGRNALPETVSEDTAAMQLAVQNAEAREATKQEINARFLEEGETFSINLCIEKAKMYQEQMASGMLGLGAQLLLLKVNTEHGNFLAAIEELGLSSRSADYAMSAAFKFGNSHTCANLESLGNSKIRALTVLDDDSAKDLVNGEIVDGLGTIDDVAQMTVHELKKALRDLRDERKKQDEEHEKRIEAVEEVVRKKESKISELELAVAGKQPPTKEEIASEALKDIRRDMIRKFADLNASLDELNLLLSTAQETENVTVDLLQSLSDGVGEFFSLFDDKYQDFVQDMENIRPMKKE